MATVSANSLGAALSRTRTRIKKRVVEKTSTGVLEDSEKPLGEPTGTMDGSPMADGIRDPEKPSTGPEDTDPATVKKGTITTGALAGGGKKPPKRGGKLITDPKLIKQTQLSKNDGPAKMLQEWHGLMIAIEHVGGDVRHPDEQHPTLIPGGLMYGYFQGVPGEDGDSLDVILGPHCYYETPEGEPCGASVPGAMLHDTPEVYIAAQRHAGTGEFVQYKVMIGFELKAEAEAAFKLLWPASMFGGVYSVPAAAFVDLVLPKLRTSPPGEFAPEVINADELPIDLHLDVAKASLNTLMRAHFDVHMAVASGDIDIDDAANYHARVVNELSAREQPHPAPPDLDLDPVSAELEADPFAPRSFEPPVPEIYQARDVLEPPAIEMVKKRSAKPVRSPGGKDVWVPLFKEMTPPHKIFIEEYAGGASFLFGKEASEREVLNERNPEITNVYKFLKGATDEDIAWMRAQVWNWSPRQFDVLKANATLKGLVESPREAVYRYKYMNLFSQRGRGEKIEDSGRARSYSGQLFLRSLEKFRDRLKNVEIVEGDALEAAAKYDSPETFHYFDPPWKLELRNEHWMSFDEAAFVETLKKLKGKVLVSYQGDIDLGPGWNKKTVMRAQGGIGGDSHQQLYWNYATDAVVKAELRKAAMPDITRKLELSGPADVVDRVERLLAAVQWCGNVGTGRTVSISIDGDGPDRLAVKGLSRKVDSSALNELADADEIKAHQVPWETKARARAEKSSGPVRFAIQEHWNGHEAHSILRIETKKGECESWALDSQLRSDAPVVDVQKAAAVDGVAALQGAMRARMLPPAPAAWMGLEGRSEIFGVEKSASKDPSVYRVVDSGTATFGLARDDVREVFLKGEHVQRRLLLRKLCFVEGSADKCARCSSKPEMAVRWAHGWAKTAVCKSCHPAWLGELVRGAIDRDLPGTVETGSLEMMIADDGARIAKSLGGTDGAWVALWQTDVTPIVLRKNEAALGESALPAELEAQVPEAHRWWVEKSEAAAVEKLKAFRIALEKCEVPFEVNRALDSSAGDRFVLQKTVTREGEAAWAVHLERGGAAVTIHLDGNPSEGAPRAQLVKCEKRAVFDLEGEVPKAHHANVFGEPVRVQKMDAGELDIVVDEEDHVRAIFKGENFAGVYELEKQDDDSWTMTKSGPVPKDREAVMRDADLRLPIMKTEEEERIVTGVVLEPEEIDAHGDYETEMTIKRAQRRFMSRYRRGTGMGIQHSIFGETGVELVESWLAHEDTTIGGKKVKKGTWLMSVHVLSDKIWARIKQGLITGFSIGGTASVPAEPEAA